MLLSYLKPISDIVRRQHAIRLQLLAGRLTAALESIFRSLCWLSGLTSTSAGWGMETVAPQ